MEVEGKEGGMTDMQACEGRGAETGAGWGWGGEGGGGGRGLTGMQASGGDRNKGGTDRLTNMQNQSS